MARFFGQDYADAVRLISQALELYRGVGHPLGLAHAHSNLARAQLFTGDDRDAAANLEAAQRLYRDLGNGLGEISILVRLARVPGPDQHGRAVDSLTRAARLSRDIGNPAAEIDALEGLGDVQAAAGDRKGADATWARAEKRAREYGIQRDAVRLAAKARRGHWPVSS